MSRTLMRSAAALLMIAGSPAQADDAVTQGHAVFDRWCAACHAPVSGEEKLPGTSTLQNIYKGSKPAALEERTDLTATLVKLYVRHGINAMPYFRKTEISDGELDALGAYLSRNNPNAH